MKWNLKNPANVLLPIFLFIVLVSFYGVNVAGSVSLFIAVLFFSYCYIYRKKRMLNWCMLPILFIVAITVLIVKFVNFGEFNVILSESIILFFLLVFFLFRKPITKALLSNSGKQVIGIRENLNLFLITLTSTSLILVIYIISFFVKRHFGGGIPDHFFATEKLILFFILWSYTTMRVYLLKGYLAKEEYWPILNEAGSVIGYESRAHVYFSKKIKNPLKKNSHPVIRILLISDNKLFLKKNDFTDLYYPDKWDTSASGHLLYGETYTDCINRLLKKNYNIEKSHAQYLLKYAYENNYECQQVFLHYMLIDDKILQNADLSNVKLWTITQVLNELDSTIFTDKLKKEIVLLKGLAFPHLFNGKKRK
jgi:isopentenyldiphosphate isomerase